MLYYHGISQIYTIQRHSYNKSYSDILESFCLMCFLLTIFFPLSLRVRLFLYITILSDFNQLYISVNFYQIEIEEYHEYDSLYLKTYL